MSASFYKEEQLATLKKILIAGIRKTKLDVFHTWLHDAPEEYILRRARNIEELQNYYDNQNLVIVDEIGKQGRTLVKSLYESGQLVLITSQALATDGIPQLLWPYTREQFLDRVRSLLENRTLPVQGA